MTAAGITVQDYSRLVERYQRLRQMSLRLHNDVLLKYLSKQAFEAGGAKLGLKGSRNQLIFDNEDQMAVLADYCLYDHLQAGGNTIARYRADAHLEPASEESTLVQALAESFHTLIEIAEVLPGVGIRAADLFAGRREYLLIDRALGWTAQKGGVLAARLFPFEEFVMTSGAGLLVDADTLHKIRASVLPQYGTEAHGQCVLTGGRQKAADLTAAIIRLCLRSKSADKIRYEDFNARPAIVGVGGGPRIGRNDPCPCGSGRKYKHCHGGTAYGVQQK